MRDDPVLATRASGAVIAERKIVLVTRRTRLEELLVRHHSIAQARFHVERLGADFDDYRREHETFDAARKAAWASLARFVRRQSIDRRHLPNFIFGPDDIVVALGQDGLVANTMKYLDGQLLVGVNSDPSRHDGVLLPFAVADLERVLPEVAANRRAAKSVTMAKATLSDGQALYAVNDLFVGPRSHTSARYEIRQCDRGETQSSSGIIVSTGLGSTAWMRSVVTGAVAVAAAWSRRGAKVDATTPARASASTEAPSAARASLAARMSWWRPMPWDAAELIYAVREPFPSVSSEATLVYGSIDASREIVLRSLMSDSGVIFSDGIEADAIEWNAGAVATIGIAERRGSLVQ